MVQPSTNDNSVESPVAFRARLREWVQTHLADDAAGPPLTRQAAKQNTIAMYDAGLLALTWPTTYGGRGLPAEYQTIWNEECAPYIGALLDNSVTVGICAATLLDLGTEEQKRRYVPPMLRGDHSWTQLLSEPSAGSDLASVSTKAVLEGDHFRLQGQKVWTSLVNDCDFAMALVRTDITKAKHAGVSMLIVDLSSDGLDVRPLREMTGDSLFNEVFIDDVLVPAENLIGGLEAGWAVLTAMLRHERISLSAGTTGRRMDVDSVPALLDLAKSQSALDAPSVQHAITEVYVQQRLLDYTAARLREAIEAEAPMGPVGSLGKIGTARAARAAAEAASLIAGMSLVAWDGDDPSGEDLAKQFLHFPMTSIAGGTTEIQKNVVAERLMKLPR